MNVSPTIRVCYGSGLETSPAQIEPKVFSPFRQRSRGDRAHTQLQQLKRRLLRSALEETPDAALFKPLCGAASDAADRSWATAWPLLVFPCLFEELIQNVRQEFQGEPCHAC
jgi:hypothetical protein